MSLMKLRRVGLGLSTGALLGVGLLNWGAHSGAQSPIPIPPDATGSALAEALGLELLPALQSGCQHYVEVDDPAGYCIDAVVTTNLEAWDVGQRLRGYTPTDLDTQIFVLGNRISEAMEVDDTATVEALIAQLEELNALRNAQGGGE